MPGTSRSAACSTEAPPGLVRFFDDVFTFSVAWRGGIVPAHAVGIDAGPNGTMALAPMLSAALAINEAFLHVFGHLATAGRRITGLDLWSLEGGDAWMSPSSYEPALQLLPSRPWLIGLGHLGQAYAGARRLGL